MVSKSNLSVDNTQHLDNTLTVSPINKSSCDSGKLRIMHTQSDGFTLSTDVINTINIPMQVIYANDYDIAEITITSTNNVNIVSDTSMIINYTDKNASLDHSFTIGVIITSNNAIPKTINDLGRINVSCKIINNGIEMLSSTLALNVLISPEAIIISEFGVDSIELHYNQWMKENHLISEEDYSNFLDDYHSVDFIIEDNVKIVNERNISTNKFADIINDQQLQLENINGSATLAVGKEDASTTTAAASSVYVKYSISLQNFGETLFVSGNVYWKDTNGSEHPVKKAYVEIIDEDIAFDDYQARIYTNNNGYFSTTFDNQTGWNESGCDIFFRIYARNTSVFVGNLSDSERIGYYFQTNTDKDIDTNITNKIQGITNTDVAKSFYVMQALNEGINYVTSIDSSETYLASAVFPTLSLTGTCYALKGMYILSDDYCDWDVILHEFGHYIADTINIENSPGGDHSSSQDLLNTQSSKSKAIRLAWSEGWATYLSIASQRYLSLGGIPNVGDYNYTDTIDSTLNYSIRTPSAIGEANERDVSYMLIMLTDYFDSKNGVDGYKYIWNTAKSAGCESFSEFYNALVGKSENNNYTTMNQIGQYAQNAKISPTVSCTNNNSTACPTFTINTIGNSNFDYSYSLHFATSSLTNQLNISPISGASYTLSPDQLNLLMTTYPNGFVWWASVDCTSSPNHWIVLFGNEDIYCFSYEYLIKFNPNCYS